MAGVFAKSFAKMGIQVISGLARGIDGAAHMGAFKADGYTCGVLGCGVDICYPRQNIESFYTDRKKKAVLYQNIQLGPHRMQDSFR